VKICLSIILFEEIPTRGLTLYYNRKNEWQKNKLVSWGQYYRTVNYGSGCWVVKSFHKYATLWRKLFCWK